MAARTVATSRRRPWLWPMLGLLGGAFLGYGYYALVGCSSGGCPITSNPLFSSLYGAAIGALLFTGRRKHAPDAAPDGEEGEV